MIGSGNTDCEALNRTFGAPERIVFRPSLHDAAVVVLANQYGSAEVSLLGAQTIAYRPTGIPPVLYMPRPYDANPAGSEIHGGIPVCWPWFGRCGEQGSKIHGLVRYAVWSVKGSEYSEDVTEVTLGISSSAETKKVWPYDFDLELKVTLSMKLTLQLRARNTGKESFLVTEGFHPYLLVRSLDKVSVRGVDGCGFYDSRELEKGYGRVWTGDYAPIAPGSKVYTVNRREYVLLDPGLKRAIAIVSRGNSKLVVWNPGPDDEQFRAVLGKDGWNRFLCVEPATLPRTDGYMLAPGEEHTLTMAIQSVPEGAQN